MKMLLRFIAILQTEHWIYSQKEDTARIIARKLKFSETHSEHSWRYFTENDIVPREGKVNLKGMDKVIQLLVEDGTLKPPLPRYDKYVDDSYLEEARRLLR